jgi:parvulin-like peptidyl-prolyl isomerase
MGAPIPFSYLVSHAPIDGTKELVQMIQQSEKAESQRAQQMSQLEQAMAQLQLSESGTEIAVTQENLAQGEQNRAKAILDNVRMLKELQEIDLSKITELLKVAREIEAAKAAKVTKR